MNAGTVAKTADELIMGFVCNINDRRKTSYYSFAMHVSGMNRHNGRTFAAVPFLSETTGFLIHADSRSSVRN